MKLIYYVRDSDFSLTVSSQVRIYYTNPLSHTMNHSHRVLCQIPTEAENTHQKFLHIRMPLDMGENLAPILGRSPSATHTKKFQITEN